MVKKDIVKYLRELRNSEKQELTIEERAIGVLEYLGYSKEESSEAAKKFADSRK